MAKKRRGLSARGRRRAKNVKHISDNKIDFSDIPESTDEELKRAVRVGRPVTGNAKQMIAVRIAPKLLARLRKLAKKSHKPYQTLLHELLEDGVNKRAA